MISLLQALIEPERANRVIEIGAERNRPGGAAKAEEPECPAELLLTMSVSNADRD